LVWLTFSRGRVLSTEPHNELHYSRSNPTIATTNQLLSNGIASIDAIKLFLQCFMTIRLFVLFSQQQSARLGRLGVSLRQRISRSDSELICTETFVINWMTA
jgi:hypothetical protein